MNLAGSYYRRKRYFKAMRCFIKAKSIDRAYCETRAFSGNAGRELETANRGNPFLAYAAEAVKKKKEEISSMKAENVIKKVNSTYAGFEKASGRIQRTISQASPQEGGEGSPSPEAEGKMQISKGSFFVNWQEELLRIEYFEPIERVMLINSSGTWLLNPAEKTAQVLKSPGVSGASMNTLLSMNPFDNLKSGFTIKRIEDFDNSIIIEARPVKPKKLSRILVKVDPKTWLAKALELFDLNGELLSQTNYENVREFKSLFFPTEFVTRFRIAEKLVIERTRLGRLKLNKKQKVSFSVPEGYTSR